MPELPEVETIRRDLEHAILHKLITEVEVKKTHLVKGVLSEFLKQLQGNRFTGLERRGKLLLFNLAEGGMTLLIHLKMTGQLICKVANFTIAGGHPEPTIEELPNKHTHIIITFEDGTILYFNDLRTFGYFKLVDHQERLQVLSRFGIEPLTPGFTWENFQALFKNRKILLKAFLLNQQLISGLGNIYVDEVCFKSKLLPDRRLNTLNLQEKKRIFNACQGVISKAVEKRGTTFSDYRDGQGNKGSYLEYLKVYGRQGEPCLRCKSEKITKIKLVGRGTHFCQNCQK